MFCRIARLFAVGVLCVIAQAALPSNASAQTNTIGFPPSRTCNAPPPPIKNGTYPGFPGHWYNPKRAGTGWDLFFTPDNPALIDVVWLSFDPQRRPVWLSNGGGNTQTATEAGTGAKQFWVPLYQVTYHFDGTTTNTQVGQVAVTFVAGTETRAAVRWQWNAVGSTAQPDECIYNYAQDQQPPGNAPLNDSYTGNWFSTTTGGWGLLTTVFTNPAGFWLELEEPVIFDVSGYPVWLQGSLANPTTGTQTITGITYAKSLYPNGVPTSNCNDVSSCISTYTAGNLTRTFTGSTTGSLSLTANVPANWASAGTAAVNWPSQPNSGVTNPQQLTKLTDINIVIVDRTVFTLPPGQTSTQVVVSWGSNDPGARVYRFDLITNTLSSTPLSSNASGQVSDTLAFGADVQYVLKNTNGGTLFTSAEVKVIAQGLPPLPANVTDPLPTHQAGVGATAGQASTDGGAATYSIPIVVPPGRAGMQPSLALNYNSRSGNGVAGVGWSISGLSSIHRCPQTPEQDSKSLGVSYQQTDKLCLDGQRLVVVNGANYGTIGAEYRTEINSYARIVQTGGDLTGNSACFRVDQKDGRILYYGDITTGSPTPTGCQGSATDARVRPGSAAATLSWLVKRVDDRVGNNQLYTYDTSAGNGEVLLHSVQYTGFLPNDIGDRTVTFGYISRAAAANGATDVASSYLAGGLTMQTRALQSITTWVNGTIARTYALAYGASLYSGRLLMTSLTECATDASTSACHPATTFNYVDGLLNTPGNFPFVALGSVTLQLSSDQSAHLPVELHTIGDLDGDGTRETGARTITLNTDGSETTHDYLIQATGDRVVHAAVDLSNTGFAIESRFFVDIDGDGRAELMKTTQTTANCPGSNPCVAFGAWKLARGASLPAGATYSTLFTDYASNIPFGAGDTFYTGDFNGDGKIDVVRVAQGTAAECGVANQAVYVYLNLITGPLGSPGNTTATFSTTPPHALCLNITTVSGATTAQKIDHIGDFNGDGLPDFYIRAETIGTTSGATNHFDGIYVTQAGGTSTVFESCGLSTLGLTNDPIATSTTDVCTWTWGAPNTQAKFVTFLDVNGDGLEDIVLARPSQGTWRIILNQGGSPSFPNGRYGSEIITTSGVGLDQVAGSPAFRYVGRLPAIDVDSDGRPDILVPTSDLGTNNNFALKVCTAFKFNFTGSQCPGDNGMAPSAPDVTLQCALYTCPQDPGSTNLNMPASIGTVPVAATYGTNPYVNSANVDNSVYHLSMLKFEQTDAAGFTVVAQDTPLLGRLHSVGQLSGDGLDLFGDGLADLTTVVGCTAHDVVGLNQCMTVADGTYGPNAPLPDGTPACAQQPDGSCYFDKNPVMYVGINEGVTTLGSSLLLAPTSNTAASLAPAPILPGLLYATSNGLGDLAQWAYAPLSIAMTYLQDGIPGYSVPANGFVDSNYYYFASSMPVVATMQQSDGIGGTSGARSADYSYGSAIYNHLGRGFQGFQSIGVDVKSLNSGRHTRTTTIYNQKFPLSGRVASITRQQGDTGTVFEQETDTWKCDGSRSACPTASTVGSFYTPLLDSQVAKNFDLTTGTQYDEVDTFNYSGTSTSGWDPLTGNLLYQLVRRLDVGTPSFLDSNNGHTITTSNSYVVDTTNWWLDKLNSTTVTSTVGYATSHAYPGQLADLTRTVTASFNWNNDRTPLTKTTQGGTVDQQSTTTYSYPSPSYGLPSSFSITAPDLPTNQSPTRATSYTYTTDGTTPASNGYFVYKATNAKGQTTTFNVRTADGQTTSVTDPNGVRVATAYDPFGRPTSIDRYDNTGTNTQIDSTIQIATQTCLNTSGSPGHCPSGLGTDSNETYAAYRTTTVHSGYPTQVSWHDMLGREIKHTERSFSNTFSETRTLYDDMGTVSEKFSPFLLGAPANNIFFSSWTYDALNRPVVKTTPASDMDFNDGDFETDYSYAGRTTSIVAHGSKIIPCPGTSGNQCIQMSRSVNALGQIMQTTDAKSGVTNYWNESLGHVGAMTDAEGFTTTAIYDALGRRSSSTDPDQGTWQFFYDAFGELRKQQDARGVTMLVNTRDALGHVTESQITPPTPIPAGLVNETQLDDWTYDINAGIGELGRAVHRVGANANPTLNPITWQEDYYYETLTARPTSITTTFSGATLNSAVTYDGYGRQATHSYPSGLVVQYGYGPYGQLGSYANLATAQIYWEVTAMDAWGKIVGESHADGTKATIANYGSTGQEKTASWVNGVGTTTDSLTYAYDSFGNLKSQNRNAESHINTESYAYDELQRLTNASLATGTQVKYGYSASGNLTYKTDYSLDTSGGGTPAYAYGQVGSGCGPHGVSSVTLPGGLSSYTYACDKNGNVVGGTAFTNTFGVDNKLRRAQRSGSGSSITWNYDSGGNLAFEVPSSLGTTRYFGPAGYEQVGSSTKFVHELGPVIVTRANGLDSLTIVLRDRLGSVIDTVDNSNANYSHARGYDAFGQVRNGDLSVRSNQTLALTDTIHGFTEHEHSDDARVIHMGGRVYAWDVGRFLSVDPIIGNPLNSQSLNPYSYIGNNPLSGTDPTGYEACPAQIGKDQAPCQVTVTVTPTGSNIAQKTTYTIGTNGTDLFVTAGGNKAAESRVQGAIDKINSISQTGQIQGAACVGSCHGTESNPLQLASAAANPRDRQATDLALGVGPVTGEISSGYELLTGHTMASGEEASRGWAAVGLATLGLGKYFGKADELVDLYHGTSREAAQAIREGGIDLSKSRAGLDFGAGFYTTTDLRQAQKWAARAADGGDVLHFQVPASELSRFRSLNLGGAGDDWEAFVRANRSGGALHNYDMVSGAMLGNPGAFARGARAEAWGQQTSFHTQSVIDLLNGSLVGH